MTEHRELLAAAERVHRLADERAAHLTSAIATAQSVATDMAKTVLELAALLPPDSADEALIVRGAVDRARQVLTAFDPPKQ